MRRPSRLALSNRLKQRQADRTAPAVSPWAYPSNDRTTFFRMTERRGLAYVRTSSLLPKCARTLHRGTGNTASQNPAIALLWKQSGPCFRICIQLSLCPSPGQPIATILPHYVVAISSLSTGCSGIHCLFQISPGNSPVAP